MSAPRPRRDGSGRAKQQRVVTTEPAIAEPTREFFEDGHRANAAYRVPQAWGRPRAAKRPVRPVDLVVGGRIKFLGDRRWWTVEATTEHYAIATRSGDFGRDSRYTVIAWSEGRRGPHNSWGYGATTRAECEETLRALEAGEIEMSERASVHLDLDLDHIAAPARSAS